MRRIVACLSVVAVPIAVVVALGYDSYRWHKRRIEQGWRWE